MANLIGFDDPLMGRTWWPAKRAVWKCFQFRLRKSGADFSETEAQLAPNTIP